MLTALLFWLLATSSFAGKVVAVSDGDTVAVMRDGKAVRVRLYGIDCPEARQPFANRAKQATARLAFGKQVRVEVRSTDRYGRIVGVVTLPSGQILNLELLKAGLAWWYYRYSPEEEYQRTQDEARAAKRGIWSDPAPVPPWEFRSRLAR